MDQVLLFYFFINSNKSKVVMVWNDSIILHCLNANITF